MKIIRVISWFLWVMLVLLIVENAIFGNTPVIFLVIVSTLLFGLVIYASSVQVGMIQDISKTVNKIDLSEVKKEIIKTREMENEFFTRKFRMEMDLDKLEKKFNSFSGNIEDYRKEFERITREYEMTYRDIARKVLELDNKMNEKFSLLGRAILKLKEK